MPTFIIVTQWYDPTEPDASFRRSHEREAFDIEAAVREEQNHNSSRVAMGDEGWRWEIVEAKRSTRYRHDARDV